MGQRSEPRISGRRISRRPSLCCNVLDQRIRRTALLWENLMSLRVRCLDGSKAGVEGAVRFTQEREKGHQEQTPKSCPLFSCAVVNRQSCRVLLCPFCTWDLCWLGPQRNCLIHHVQNHNVNGEGKRSRGDSSHIGTKRSYATGMRESTRRSRLRREGVWDWSKGRIEDTFSTENASSGGYHDQERRLGLKYPVRIFEARRRR